MDVKVLDDIYTALINLTESVDENTIEMKKFQGMIKSLKVELNFDK